MLNELDLKLNLSKTKLVDFDRGFEFLGYLFVRSLAMPKNEKYYNDEIVIPNIPAKTLQKEEGTTLNLITETKGRTDYAKGDKILYVMERNRQILLVKKNIEVQTNEGHLILAINSSRIDRIELGMGVHISQEMMRLCLEENIQLIFLNGWGQQLGRLTPNEDERAALQFSQAISCANKNTSVTLSRQTIDARIRNQRTQLFRLNRRQNNCEVEGVLKIMGRNLRKLPNAKTVDEIRGLEGASAALYWPALGVLCDSANAPLRRTRPAKDPLNAAINYLTYMLERDVRSAVRSAGLHVGFGFLHKPNDYNEAAVYDMMEPFRAPLTEGLPVYLFNAKRLKVDMFEENSKGIIWMNQKARKAIISAYEKAVAKQINIPNKKTKISWRRMMWFQANSLAKAYRKNNMSLFTPYLMEA